MKTKLILFSVICMLLSCAKKHNTTFSGTIKGLSKGTVYLQQIKDTNLITIDSIALNGSNKFNFNLDLNEPDVFMLYLDKKDGTIFNDRLKIFLQPGEIKLTTKLEDFNNSAKMTGSPNQLKLEEYNAMIQKFNIDDFKLAQLNNFAQKSGRQDYVDATIKDLDKLIKRKYLYSVNFALNNKNLEIAPYIAVSEINDINIKYLDTIYKSLPEQIKTSKYGIQLEALRHPK